MTGPNPQRLQILFKNSLDCAGRAKRRRRFGRSALIANDTQRPDSGRPPSAPHRPTTPRNRGANPGRARRRRAATNVPDRRDFSPPRASSHPFINPRWQLDRVSPYQKRLITNQCPTPIRIEPANSGDARLESVIRRCTEAPLQRRPHSRFIRVIRGQFPNFFVTSHRATLSYSAVWTCFPLHG